MNTKVRRVFGINSVAGCSLLSLPHLGNTDQRLDSTHHLGLVTKKSFKEVCYSMYDM